MTVALSQKNEIAPFSSEQVALIKNYLCKGITDEEVKLFHDVCKMKELIQQEHEENYFYAVGEA